VLGQRKLKANIRSGNLGKPGSKRRRKAESKPIGFPPRCRAAV
jgi:putative transposase